MILEELEQIHWSLQEIKQHREVTQSKNFYQTGFFITKTNCYRSLFFFILGYLFIRVKMLITKNSFCFTILIAAAFIINSDLTLGQRIVDKNKGDHNQTKKDLWMVILLRRFTITLVKLETI